MTLQDPAPFLVLCVALVVLSIAYGRSWREHAFGAVNVLFLGVMFAESMRSFGVLLAALATHYALLSLMRRLREKGRNALFWCWLVATLVAFAIVKQYGWLTDLFIDRSRLPVIETVGYSFLLFRQVHLAMQVRDGMLDRISPLRYFNYSVAFWTFLAGPMQRYVEFAAQFDAPQPESPAPSAPTSLSARSVLIALNRVMIGFFKMFIVGALLQRLIANNALVFPLHMYVNFSGYCDIMIGLAAAVGFTLPENFKHPYLARNSLDFWTRWHISLSEFFRDHLYFPLVTALSRKIPALVSMVIATLASFTVMGIWHGSSPRFAVFGLIHALGVVAATLYQRWLKRRLGKAGLARYMENRAIHVAAVLIFQAYVVLSFIPFQYELDELMAMAGLP